MESYLTDIINSSLAEGSVPESYKSAFVTPVYKSGDPSLATNYRPISLLPLCAKLLEKIVLQQLLDFFRSNGVKYVQDQQFAYRQNHSCEDALSLVINRWHTALDDNLYCGLILADMSKAFDRVKHADLIMKWMCSYLTGRTQTVHISGSCGDTAPCTRGVPQGSVLGPLLFCIYINDVHTILSKSISQLFADDIAFYVTSISPHIISHTLSLELQNLDRYLDGKGLLLNPNKTQFIMLRRPNKPLPEGLSVSCRGSTLTPVRSARYLGIIIDEHLTFEEQVEKVCTQANGKVAAFRHGRRNLSYSARRLFYLSIIQSTLEYASTSYIHSLNQRNYNRLLTTSTIAIKKIFSLDRRTANDFTHRYANLYTLEQRLNLKTYVFVYRCMNGLASTLISSLFTPLALAPHTHAQTRGQTSAALSLPHPKSRFGFHALSYLAADRWNALPADCRQARSPAEFAAFTRNFLGYPVRRPKRL